MPRLPGKEGETWDPKTRRDVTLRLAEYVETRLHFEKVLVLWGDAGMQKTPTAEAIANHLAENYGTNRYIKASSPDALRVAQLDFSPYVPIILEDWAADDVSQHGRSMSANYLKHLLDVKNGGQCRVRNTNVCFHPLQPKIVCVNDTPENWIRAVEGMSDSDEQPLKKRLLFVHVDTAVLAEEAVAAHERGLDALVEEGKRRRLERVRTLCGTAAEAETATGPGDASPAASTTTGGSSSPTLEFQRRRP